MRDNIVTTYLEPKKYHALASSYFVILLIKFYHAFFKALFLILLLMPYSTSVRAADYEIITTNLPPWSIQGKTGIFPDLVKEIEKRLGNNHQPQNLPWSRAQRMAKNNNDNYIIFPMTRTPNRENTYKWIVKVMPTQLVFGTLGPHQKDLETARDLHSILVHQDSPPYYFLAKKGFKNLTKSPFGVSAIPKMLEIGRADAWFTALAIMKYATHGTSLEGRLNFSPSVNEAWLYIAGSKNISEELANDYRMAFKTIKAEGMYDQIIQKYLGK